MSDTINTITDMMVNDTGVLYYASKLLKENGIEITGRNQYQLLVWFERNNKEKIQNHLIKGNTIIVRPKERVDFLRICSFKITLNETEEVLLDNNYCMEFADMFIFKSKKQPGFDRHINLMPDMKFNDKTDADILKMGKEFKSTIDEYNKTMTREVYFANPTAFKHFRIGELCHIGYMRDLLQTCSFLNFNMRKVNEALLQHFIDGTGEDYESSALTHEVRKNKSTVDYVGYSISAIERHLKEYYGDICQLFNEDVINTEFQKSVALPSFENPFTGLMIAIHVTHGNNIEITNARIENNVFKCKIKFDIFDHYGLNADDLDCSKAGIKFISLAGFRAWYYLQHSVNYEGKFKPFVTHAIFYEDFEVRL